MSDLFPPNKPAAPLAERLRPTNIDEVIGQSHLLGEGKPLRLAFRSGKLHSMILWGPPGVGKTSLACASAIALADRGQRVLLVDWRVQGVVQAVTDGDTIVLPQFLPAGRKGATR